VLPFLSYKVRAAKTHASSDPNSEWGVKLIQTALIAASAVTLEDCPGCSNVREQLSVFASAITGFNTCGFAEDANLGKVDYESSCAACHGQNGKGDGPVSEELRTRPSDLTLIAKKNGGAASSSVRDSKRSSRAEGDADEMASDPRNRYRSLAVQGSSGQ
jgi:hypothetical protein